MVEEPRTDKTPNLDTVKMTELTKTPFCGRRPPKKTQNMVKLRKLLICSLKNA